MRTYTSKVNFVTLRTEAVRSLDYWLLSRNESGLHCGIRTRDQAILPTWASVSVISKWWG